MKQPLQLLSINIANAIDTTKMEAPLFKMVLTGIGDYAYCRKDEILIVPFGSLKD